MKKVLYAAKRFGVLTNQPQLERVVQDIFPTEKILTNVKQDHQLFHTKTRRPLEVDVWIPSLGLCFEFQDIHHYDSVYYAQISLSSVKYYDMYKKERLQKRKRTVIYIPYWWIGDAESIIGTILFHRPDLSSSLPFSFVPPVSLNPAQTYTTNIPGIGELMQAAFLLEPDVLSRSPYWWVGEKYDGIRFCWHPERRVLYSRFAMPLRFSQSVRNHFGNLFLDGEYWPGRNCFAEAHSLIKLEVQPQMLNARFVTFDVADTQKSFEARYAAIVNHLPIDNPVLELAPRVMFDSMEIVNEKLANVIESGAEGLIMRQYASRYIQGRSNSLLKLKAVETDAEALVVVAGAQPTLKFPNGDTFNIVPKKGDPVLKKGDVVTVGYAKRTQYHLPVEPSIVRVRTDITWEQVLDQHNWQKPKSKMPNALPKFYKMGANKLHTFRAFFEAFAKRRNFDPLVAANWYHVSTKEVYKEKGGGTILRYYFLGNLQKALLTVFPRIGLDLEKFPSRYPYFWASEKNRRNHMVSIAKKIGFDPLVAQNWYLHKDTVEREASMYMITTQYTGLYAAVQHLFPDIGMIRDIYYKRHPVKYWTYEENRRQFFVNFAHDHNFDPLVPENWYKVSRAKFSLPSFSTILPHHQNNHRIALMDLFPHIGLKMTGFDRRQPVPPKKQPWEVRMWENFWSKESSEKKSAKQKTNRHEFSKNSIPTKRGVGRRKAACMPT